MGRWKGATSKEYIRKELSCYSEGMTKNMKQNFKFVNLSRNVYPDIMAKCLEKILTSIAQWPRKLPVVSLLCILLLRMTLGSAYPSLVNVRKNYT